MAEQPLTFEMLVEFHRTVVVPDIERILAPRFDHIDRRFDDVFSHFDAIYADAIYAPFDRLESEWLSAPQSSDWSSASRGSKSE